MKPSRVRVASGVAVALTALAFLLAPAFAKSTSRSSRAAPTPKAAPASKPAPAPDADGALLAQGDRPLAPARENKPAEPSSSADPAAVPATNEAPPERAESARAVNVPDLAKLRADYDRLREELFKARVRSQKVADVVYASKFDVSFRWKGRPDFVIRKARFLLDGAEIWDSTDKNQTDDRIDIASRSVKPGPHALTVSLEVRPKAETKGGAKTGADKLGYTSEHVFAIAIPDSGQTHLLLTGDEDGDPPEYEPELELEVKTEK